MIDSLSYKCYTLKMNMCKTALQMYINHIRKVCDDCTMEDVHKMLILGILLLINEQFVKGYAGK